MLHVLVGAAPGQPINPEVAFRTLAVQLQPAAYKAAHLVERHKQPAAVLLRQGHGSRERRAIGQRSRKGHDPSLADLGRADAVALRVVVKAKALDLRVVRIVNVIGFTVRDDGRVEAVRFDRAFDREVIVRHQHSGAIVVGQVRLHGGHRRDHRAVTLGHRARELTSPLWRWRQVQFQGH